MLDSTLPEERTDGTALHKQGFLPADAECDACSLFFKIGEAVLKQEPREIPDDEDGNPFLNLASLLRIKISAGKLASAIESEGIYTWDKYGRFGLANDVDKQRALDLIEIFYKWKNTPPQEEAYEDTQSPLDRCNDYFKFGWASEVAPDFDSIGNAHIQAKLDLTSSPKPSVSAWDIRCKFTVIKSEDANDQWWKKMMRNASDTGLKECRVGGGKRGRGGSLWRPDLIAGWLVDRADKKLGGNMSKNSARAALKKFTGYEETAEELFPSDE